MGCLTVNKFLCCISLETGGMIVGWINLIVSFLAIFGMIAAISLTIVGHNEVPINNDNVVGSFISLMISYSIFLIYYLIVFIASLLLIQGTRQRDHTKMVLFLILMAIGVFLQFVQLLTVGWQIIFSSLFFALWSLYFFACIHSLYKKIKGEKMGQPYV